MSSKVLRRIQMLPNFYIQLMYSNLMHALNAIKNQTVDYDGLLHGEDGEYSTLFNGWYDYDSD